MSNSEKPSIISHLLGPFGDRLRQLDHIGNSFERLRTDYRQMSATCEKHKELIMDNIRGKEKLIAQIDLFLTQLEDKIQECNDCMDIVKDTDEFKQAHVDYQSILAEVRAGTK